MRENERMTTPDPTRRRLLNWLVSLGSGGLFGVLLYPIVRYMTPVVATSLLRRRIVEDFEHDMGLKLRLVSGQIGRVLRRRAIGRLRTLCDDSCPKAITFVKKSRSA